MKVLVLGATGRTGRLLLPRLEAQGAEVTTFGRRKVDGIAGTIASLDDRAAMARAIDGVDTVLSCLASSRDTEVCRAATLTLIAVAPEGLRHVVIGGAAVDVDGDAKGLGDRIAGGLMRLFAGRMLAERQAELADLQASRLAWTFLRPPGLTNGAGTGRWQFSDDFPRRKTIARADLAAAMLDSAGRSDHHRRAPFVSSA
jgi:putative NADH-flavin reductase